MATIYSLICWGGKDGKSVTGSDPATDRITIANHGVRSGYPLAVQFSAGTLMTGANVTLALNTTYYAKYFNANEFEIYDSALMTTRITWTGAGSGLTMKSAYWQGLTSGQKARYGDAGSERVFASYGSWNTTRAAATTALDVEMAEFVGTWDDITTSAISVNMGCAAVIIAPEVAGQKTDACNDGVFGAGYRLVCNTDYVETLTLGGFNVTMRNLTVHHNAGGGSSAVTIGGFGTEFSNNFVTGHNSGKTSRGIYIQATAGKVLNNIVAGFNNASYAGLYHWQYIGTNCGTIVANNFVTKCGVGFDRSGAGSNSGIYYNNGACGNTVNWGTQPTGLTKAAYNFGESGDVPWNVGAATARTSLNEEADPPQFVDWANNDFHPTLNNPMRDDGATVYGIPALDMIGARKPSYNDGGAETWDAGPFEYDNGYGNPPATLTIAANVSLVGAEIRIYDYNASGNDLGDELAGVESASGSTADYLVGSGNTVWIQIMLDGYEEFGQSFVMPDASTTFTATLRADANV